MRALGGLFHPAVILSSAPSCTSAFTRRAYGLRLEVGLKWVMRGFAGFVPAARLLAFWDRLIGTGDLRLLPGYATSSLAPFSSPFAVAAAALLASRREELLGAGSQEEFNQLLADLGDVDLVSQVMQYLAGHSVLSPN